MLNAYLLGMGYSPMMGNTIWYPFFRRLCHHEHRAVIGRKTRQPLNRLRVRCALIAAAGAALSRAPVTGRVQPANVGRQPARKRFLHIALRGHVSGCFDSVHHPASFSWGSPGARQFFCWSSRRLANHFCRSIDRTALITPEGHEPQTSQHSRIMSKGKVVGPYTVLVMERADRVCLSCQAIVVTLRTLSYLRRPKIRLKVSFFHTTSVAWLLPNNFLARRRA